MNNETRPNLAAAGDVADRRIGNVANHGHASSRPADTKGGKLVVGKQTKSSRSVQGGASVTSLTNYFTDTPAPMTSSVVRGLWGNL
jgi:hypothetical protein